MKPFLTNGMRALGALIPAILISACAAAMQSEPREERNSDDGRLKVLFLGDGGLHRPGERLRDIATPMLNRGVELIYSEDVGVLSLETLRQYDALMLFADYEGDLATAHEAALVDYVAGGGGFVAVHAASANFPRSDRYIELVGGQFESHGTGVFRTRIAEPDHEVMRGFEGFESWDETVVHRRQNPDRVVMSYRDDEPYTWIRTHGQGRVFYTAWGHDERTWRNDGFHQLLERGIRWAAGQDVQQVLAARQVADPFEYVVLDVPFPPPHRVRMEYEETVQPMDRGSNNPRFYQMQQPLSPRESMSRMIVPPGFRVELFAAEPDVVNPIAMSWDEWGRLWVIESVEYPYPRELWPDGGGKDRIKILEDTDGDGRADEVTVFADGLNIPTTLTFANGGIIVQQAPQTLFLKDTDGDDRADVREVLFEGWSLYDTHAGPSNLHYGLDNWVWGVLGYSGFDGTVGGERHEFDMGVYRFKNDGSALEFLRRTNNNTWGLGFDEAGGPFISTANGNPSTYLPFARRHYDALPDLDDSVTDQLVENPRILPLSNEFRQVDWVGAFTAAAGHAPYTARTYPRTYWNRISFVSEPTGHLVAEFNLEARGSSYEALYPRNLIASDDEWFAPVVAEVGPDGHMWIADWYNYVLQHNAESDRQEPSPGNAYANPLRDRGHGRIYRIVYDGAPPSEPMSLAGAGPEELVRTLRHENRLWRIHAQRLLVEGNQISVVPSLIQLVQDPSVDEIGLNAGAIHALWTLHGLGQLDGSNPQALAAARGALRHPSAGVRRNAVNVLPEEGATATAILDSDVVNDDDAQVRLAALVALIEVPPDLDAGRAILSVLQEPANRGDRWIREAATLAAAVHSGGFLAAAGSAGVVDDASGPQGGQRNLLPNSAFEQVEDGRPVGWTSREGEEVAEIAISEGEGRNGGNGIEVVSSGEADASWESLAVELKSNTRYRIAGWIRTEGVESEEDGGARFHLDGVSSGEVRTSAVTGTRDWTYVETIFTTSEQAGEGARLVIGGEGFTGEAWFDDVALEEIGPDPTTTLAGITAMIRQRDAAAGGLEAENVADAAPADAADSGEVDAVLEVGVTPSALLFDTTELRVEAGQRVRIVFNNTDHMEHNLVVIMPGSFAGVGRLADELALSSQGRTRNYVPDSPDVLASTPIVEPSAAYELTFTVPEEPGEYPFICTIPGHWRSMRGTLIVEPAS